MGHLGALFLALGLFGTAPAAAQPVAFPPGFTKADFQSLLQRFVNEQYLKSFRDLGVEDDFDHGHILSDPRSPGRPVAILYHTQELGGHPSMDPKARNWLQWVDRGTVEDASRYERKSYPRTAAWDWFIQRDLQALRQRHTILDKMLDPGLLGIESPQSRQWVFTRADCGQGSQAADSGLIRVLLPSGSPVCLSLSQD